MSGKTLARRSVALGCAATVFVSTLASAQSTSLLPQGSPLDPYGQQQQQQQQQQQSNSQPAPQPAQSDSGSIQPVEINNDTGTTEGGSSNGQSQTRAQGQAGQFMIKKAAPPSEYERFVERALGKKLPRFGSDLLIQSVRDFATPATATVPPSYVLNPGDNIFIGLSGAIDGTVDAQIDNNGQIFLPKVGPVNLAGVTYGDLKKVVTRAIGTQYRDFRVSVSVTRLRGIRVYVTGFANNPGGYSVAGLSTMANAVLAAGGPSAGGSFRQIKLYRNGALVSDFDLYDLIRNGDKSRDAILQNEDVLYIPPVGGQVAITGSVNSEAIYEARPGESVEKLLTYAGGANSLADSSRVILYSLENRDKSGGLEVSREQLASMQARSGDIVQVLSLGSLQQPLSRQSVVVKIDGEVNRPGNYYVAPSTPLSEVIRLAGGLTPGAFVYGTNFQRVSVRQQQQEAFSEAVQQFEVSLAAAPITQDTSLGGSANQVASAKAVLDRLKEAEPDGRVVLDISPDATTLPGNLVLENNDSLYVPPRPTTVGVFGAVYRPASFIVGDGRNKSVKTYLDMAGGAMRAGDKGQIFVVRANGAVISKQRGALNARVLPGDVIFVPVKTQANTFWLKLQQISSIVFQFGLSAAAFYAVAK